jgi:hypothetical protein
MANQTSPFVQQRVVAFALGQPGFGPSRISAELRREKWGGIVLSPNGVHRVLRRHGLNTRAKRLGLVAGYAAPPEPDLVRSSQSGISTCPDLGRWSRWTASSSAASQAPARLHAKCEIRDGAEALIRSANLTSAAIYGNMELGRPGRGRRHPLSPHRHFHRLIDADVPEPA